MPSKSNMPEKGKAPDKIVATLLHHAADLIESRHYPRFFGGPDIWTALFLAADEILVGPAIGHARRTLGASQVQYWRGTKSEAVAALRAAAGTATGELAGYQDAAALAALEEARVMLRDALGGYINEPDVPLRVLAEEIRCKLAERDQMAEQYSGKIRAAEEAHA